MRRGRSFSTLPISNVNPRGDRSAQLSRLSFDNETSHELSDEICFEERTKQLIYRKKRSIVLLARIS